MGKVLFRSFKGYKPGYLKNDIPAGIVVAALTIPVAMGYAQVAGLPPIYGLYASILPVLGYVLFASSPQLVYGIDAGGAAITGSAMAALGITAASPQAVAAAPVLALFAGVFLVLFALLRLGRFSEYISRPVMSGFITGISLSILFGQLPKVLGLTPGGSGFFDNVSVLFTQAAKINPWSAVLGGVTILVIVLGKKFLRKVPMALVVLVLATLLSWLLNLQNHGVEVVGTIPEGFPPLSLPDLRLQNWPVYIGYSLAIAVVVFTASVLAADSFAERGGYRINPNQEAFAYGFSSLVAAFNGCPPTSGSVSRTAASVQFRAKTQLVSVVAGILTLLVVLFLGGVLYYMPQPVLGGIVLASMLGVLEISVARRLFKTSRTEAVVWAAAALGVLLVGVLFGVALGVILSMLATIVQIATPPRAFLGTIPGREGYHALKDHPNAQAIPAVAIYRFSSRLFFANARLFVEDVQKAAAEPGIKCIVISAEGINSIDDTAADMLRDLLDKLTKQGIQYYFVDLGAKVRSQFAGFGLTDVLAPGHQADTVLEALKKSGHGGPAPAPATE